jgi:hypothetical protein
VGLAALMVKVQLGVVQVTTPEMAVILAAGAVVSLVINPAHLVALEPFASYGLETFAPSHPLMSAHRKEK